MASGRRGHRRGGGRSGTVGATLAIALALAAPGLADSRGGPRPADPFAEVAESAGLVFRHDNGMSGQLYLPEMTGQGAALFDYDNDGDLDAYLVQGEPLVPGEAVAGAGTDRLFRNELRLEPDGTRRLRFVDVSEEAGIGGRGYGMGVAAGDFDDDGWTDLYVTRFGANSLLRNRGDGTFGDVTAASGAGDPAWSTSATFFDFDRDGLLDLFVVNYVDFGLERNVTCYAESTRRDYCGPSAFTPVRDRLFHNRGGGRFEDVTQRALSDHAAGAGLGVAAGDFDGDGSADLYVANDGLPNHLWLGDGRGRFRDQALLAGAALNWQGSPEASMGIACADYDRDGDEDLFVTHLAGETNTLYVNDGGLFEDRSILSGLGPASRPRTGFGTGWLDYDNDGALDLLVLNGAVEQQEALLRAGDPYPLGQANQLFRNRGDGRYEEVTASAGPAFALIEVSRGAAFGDVDNDGDTDVLISNNNGPARLLLNQLGQASRWVGLRLVGGRGGRDMLGAWLELRREGAGSSWHRARSDGSYASASDPRILVGLGAAAPELSVSVHWPSGRVERWSGLRAGRYTTLREGAGAVPE